VQVLLVGFHVAALSAKVHLHRDLLFFYLSNAYDDIMLMKLKGPLATTLLNQAVIKILLWIVT
jgi:hypothetical protein